MIKSMTGFGFAECELRDRKISITIRSVNSKQLDISMHLPAFYRTGESDIRNEIAKIAVRGKLDFSMNVLLSDGQSVANINANAVCAYFEQLKNISKILGAPLNDSDAICSILRLPGVLNIEETDENEDDWKIIIECLKSALNEFDLFRQKEGGALIVDILHRVDKIEKYICEIEPFEKKRINNVRNRLGNAIEEFFAPAQIDKNRFEQELIYYIEKLDITEEKTRLKQHCSYFKQTVNDENPGRKIGFICQEMGREINTLGSKANDADIQKIVVKMKDELEKIKEQILNIL